jgi:hypothetical protein
MVTTTGVRETGSEVSAPGTRSSAPKKDAGVSHPGVSKREDASILASDPEAADSACDSAGVRKAG